MKSTFLQRNKKKSLLAALLLFLRERKVLVLLLLLVLVASTVFVSPSSWITGLPGGTRLAASVAWMASKMGVDVSRYGFGSGRHSFAELNAALAAAKANAGKGSVGWGAFFGRGAAAGGAGGAGAAGGSPDSLGFVKGSKSDLESANASGKGGSASGIAGAISPEDAKNDPDANAVAIDASDVTGEREGWVKSAFAGGFVNGLLGGAGAGGAGSLSGGAFASAGFFSGRGGAATESNALARSGLSGTETTNVPKPKIQGAAKGALSASRAHVIDARAMRGASGASRIGVNRAFTQLAEGRGRAMISVSPNCNPPGCPGEFATTNTGAIYDGNHVQGAATDIIMAPEVDHLTTPNIPDTGMAQQYEDQAAKMTADADKCKQLDEQYGPTETALNQQMKSISDQFKSAGCGSGGCSKSKANYCKGLGNRLRSVCSQYMSVRCQHTHACPLTANTNCSNECREGGNGGTGNATATQFQQDGQTMTTVPQ